VERNGTPVARLVPAHEAGVSTLAEAAAAWQGAGAPDESFADDLERIGAADRAPDDPWAS
jgi:hypothetical protein